MASNEARLIIWYIPVSDSPFFIRRMIKLMAHNPTINRTIKRSWGVEVTGVVAWVCEAGTMYLQWT